MSALAKRFPKDVKKVFCSHCNRKVHPRVRYRHLQGLEQETHDPDTLTTGTDPSDDEVNFENNYMEIDTTYGSEEEGAKGAEEAEEAEAEEAEGEAEEDIQVPTNNIFDDTFKSDSEQSDRSESSRDSWHHVPTPLPSPPQSPLPESDEHESDNDEGFRNIEAHDYREYERWYAKDNLLEEDEIDAETLTEEEIDTIIMLAIRQFGTLTQGDYERIRYSYRHKLKLMSPQRLRTRIAKLSGVKPVNIDCCVNICHAYTGKYANETVCSQPLCREPRYDYKGRPRQTFQYLPTTPRFQAMFNNPELIRKMLYRANFVQRPGEIIDIFNSELYLDLLDTNITIDGIDTGTRHFSGRHDIAISVMTDGVELFEFASKSKSTCWPIMAQNLNLPPAERAQLRNLIPIGVIPGPNKPKDFDSFLVPFVEECIQLAKGVKTQNVLTGRTFTLRMHPIIVSGDMQAMKYIMNFKGPNGVVPCRGCLMSGVYHKDKKTYYIPLAEPLPNDGSLSTVKSYDPHNLPLRTNAKTAAQTNRIQNAATPKQAKDLGKKFGICGPSILDRIPSIQRPSSYPHEFMHLFLLNHGPDLLSLWIGSHNGLPDDGSNHRLISRADFILIGVETESATYLLPANFIRPLPNIESSRHLYTAESWCFWLVYIGPVVLRGRLPESYYEHYLEFVSILKCLLNLETTVARIEQLREEIIHYVERFEELYYQYDYERLGVCKLVVHALLHVADDVLRCGPVWVAWSFSIERYCREIVGCAKSKVVPYPTINRHVLQMSQLAAVATRFPLIRKAMLFGKASAPVKASSMEQIYAEYPDTILRFPRLRGFPLDNEVRRRLAAFFHTNYPEQTFHAWLDFIPERAERWGKLRIPDGGDSIRCADVVDPLSPYGKRDSSFVRYTFQKDANENFPNLNIRMVEAFGYGRLDFILALALPADKDFGLDEPRLHILAHITEAKHGEGDATTEFVSFTEFGRSIILDISSVQRTYLADIREAESDCSRLCEELLSGYKCVSNQFHECMRI
ncbi:unnamed protein product [Rhizoctonia solani]|uniref:Transposase family Tnp2 protein n=1 Tax=Rhizoctonia solani TaxID=456999 RepID=A0A8H3HFR0_9AGAM|nr:unnamed protein product [Rhizoctonia solani]